MLSGKTPTEQSARPPTPTALLDGGSIVNGQRATPTTTEPDPEIALIAETLRGYRDELRDVRSQMVAADERHRREMRDAETRHQQSMTEVRRALEESEKTRVRLEAMIDVLTGRRPPPEQPPGPPSPPGPRHQGL